MRTQVREPITHRPTVEARTRQQKAKLGHVSLSVNETGVLSWSCERRLHEFQKVNEGVETQFLANKLLYIDTLTVGNGEIYDVLRLHPTLTWEQVRDVFLGGPVDGYPSTFHRLGDINYPEYFWKAIIENEMGKLPASDGTADDEL
jgi:hypothetical protein